MDLLSLDVIGLSHGTDKASNGHDYLRHYDATFQHLRNDDFLMIEIGGLNGASLKMWSEYFPNARIVCLDIDENVKQYENGNITVEIGNSGSSAFLKEIAAKYGSAKIILDDGSHRWDHQRVAFKELFSMVEDGGFYVVEDIHTSYEAGFAGSDDHPFTDYLKIMVDYLHQRGDRKKEFERRYSAEFIQAMRKVDTIHFVPRSCIIRKKGQAYSQTTYDDAGAKYLARTGQQQKQTVTSLLSRGKKK